MNAEEIVRKVFEEMPVPNNQPNERIKRAAELGIAEGRKEKGRFSHRHKCPKCSHEFVDVVEYEKFKAELLKEGRRQLAEEAFVILDEIGYDEDELRDELTRLFNRKEIEPSGEIPKQQQGTAKAETIQVGNVSAQSRKRPVSKGDLPAADIPKSASASQSSGIPKSFPSDCVVCEGVFGTKEHPCPKCGRDEFVREEERKKS